MQPLAQVLPALVLTLAAAAALVWTAFRPESGRAREAGFALLILLVLAAWRWPALYSPVEFNPDEGQMIAGALTLFRDPVFWRSVDGTTSGPLNFYALMPLLALDGLPAVFAARLSGLLMVWGALVLTFALLRRAVGPVAAVLGFLPAWLLHATTTDSDFIHYSSEHLSLPLVALAALLLWQSRTLARGPADSRWLLAAFSAGLLPWAKPQSAPLAAFFAAVAVGVAIAARDQPVRARLLAVGSFAAASLLPAGLFLAMLGLTGQQSHFTASYITNNISYTANDFTVSHAVAELWRLLWPTWCFPSFAAACLALAVAGLVAATLRRQPPGWLFGLALAAVGLATAAVLTPRMASPHYVLYLVLPGAWLAAAGTGLCLTALPRHRAIVVSLALIPGLFFPLAARLTSASPWGFVPAGASDDAPGSRIAELVRVLARPGDSLAIWGWCPLIWVECRLPQATRDGNSFRQLQPSPQRDGYYRPRFLADLRLNHPELFLDGTGPGSFLFRDRQLYGHEDYPDLAAHVREHYVLIADAVGMRFYLRRDLVILRREELVRAENILRDLHARGETPVTLPRTDLSHRTVYRRDAIHLQTPADIFIPLEGNEREFLFTYGFEATAYASGDTNGADIRLELLIPGRPARLLFTRFLNPRNEPADRGLLSGRVTLPALPPGAQLAVRTRPGPFDNNAWDWVFLADTRFVRRLGAPSQP